MKKSELQTQLLRDLNTQLLRKYPDGNMGPVCDEEGVPLFIQRWVYNGLQRRVSVLLFDNTPLLLDAPDSVGPMEYDLTKMEVLEVERTAKRVWDSLDETDRGSALL